MVVDTIATGFAGRRVEQRVQRGVEDVDTGGQIAKGGSWWAEEDETALSCR
jgi:hypothetical protein